MSAVRRGLSAGVTAQENGRQPSLAAQVLDAQQPFHFGDDAAFFLDLPQDGALRGLAGVYDAPGDAPLPCQRVALCLTHKESPLLVEDHGANTHNHPGRPV